MLDPVTLSAGGWFMPVILVAALIDSVNPCAFSILFLTITFLFSLQKDRGFIVKAGSAYIFGIFLVYTLIGIGFLQVLSIFNIPNGLAKIGACILILYALIGVINEFFPNFPIKLKIPARSHRTLATIIQKGSILASFILGIFIGLFEFPCTGGPYLFVLSLLHDQANMVKGIGYLLLYNAVFVLPLVLILAFAVNKFVLDKIDKLRRLETKRSRLVLLCILLAIGVAILYI